MRNSALRNWLEEELDERGLGQCTHTLLALAQKSCTCVCRQASPQPHPSLRVEMFHDEHCEEERKKAVTDCLLASCVKTAGLTDFVEEICSRLKAVQVQGHLEEDAMWSLHSASPNIKADNTFPELQDDNFLSQSKAKPPMTELHGIFNTLDPCTFCLPKLPTAHVPRVINKSNIPFNIKDSMLDLDAEGFDSAFEDLEPDSLCSNSSGKRLYERGWESEESPLNSCNSSRESSEERSTEDRIVKKERKEKGNNNNDRETPIFTAIAATDSSLTPRNIISDVEDSDELKEFCSKIMSIAELWESAGNWAGLKDSLASEFLKLDNVSLSFPSPKQESDPKLSLELDLLSLLSTSARSLFKETEDIGGSILAGVMCESPSSPKKAVYVSLPDKWFSFQGPAISSKEEESSSELATPERNARRKLSFQVQDEMVEIECFSQYRIDDESDDDDDDLAMDLKGIKPLNLDDKNDPLLNSNLQNITGESSWNDSMWQVEPHNSLSPEHQQDVTLGAISNVAEEMIRVILEDTPDGKKWKDGACNDCIDANCSQEFVHHAQQSCFKTVLPGSTRYHNYQDDDCFYPQYRNSTAEAENLLISSRTHFKPIHSDSKKGENKKVQLEKITMLQEKIKHVETETGADVDEIEKDALESAEFMISEVDHEFEFLKNYGYDTSPKCPSIIKSMLEPLELPDSSCNTPESFDLDDGWVEGTTYDTEPKLGYSLPYSMGGGALSKMTNIWECKHDKEEQQSKWNTVEPEEGASTDPYEMEQAVPVEYLDDELLMQAFTLQQEMSNSYDLPALPIDSDGRVLYSSELEEDWKLNAKPFSVQIPKKNKSRRVTANKKACHYFLGGGCARDSECRYSHDPASITCRFWEQESCLKGITCEFLHAYNHSPRRRQYSEGDVRKRGRPRKHASFEITSHTDFPELSLDEDKKKRGRGSTSSE